MSQEALAEFSRRLSMLSEPGVEGVYQTAYKDCAFDGTRPPRRGDSATHSGLEGIAEVQVDESLIKWVARHLWPATRRVPR
jgi:hypothetical protein